MEAQSHADEEATFKPRGPQRLQVPQLSTALAGGDWPAKVADAIEDAVSAGRKVAGVVLLVTRILIFGSVVAVATSALAILFGMGLVRLLDDYFFGKRVWIADVGAGIVLWAIGVALWTIRNHGTESA